MISRWQKIKLSLFIILALSILVFVLLYLGTNKIFESFDIYYVKFSDLSVHGLEVGTPVKLQGVRIGRIDDLSISREDMSSVIVKISVKNGTPITDDVTATLEFLGITGLKYMELTHSSDTIGKLIKPGATIPQGKSIVESISGKAEVLAIKAEILLTKVNQALNDENINNFSIFMENLSEISKNVNTFSTAHKGEFAEILGNFNLILDHTEGIMSQIAEVNIKNTVAGVDSIVTNFNDEKTIENLNDLINNTNAMVTHLDLTLKTSREDLVRTIRIMKETMENLNSFARIISENPSLLLRKRELKDEK